MTPDSIMTIFQQMLEVMVILLSLLLLPALVVGVLVSMFQAATQINEMTLSFIPKLFVTLAVLMIAGNWMLRMLTDYATRLFENIPMLIG